MQHFYFYDSKYGHLCCHYNDNKILSILDEQSMNVYLLEPNRFKYVLESLFPQELKGDVYEELDSKKPNNSCTCYTTSESGMSLCACNGSGYSQE